jgi:probable biosynthetic protein (TIGR04098 family)
MNREAPSSPASFLDSGLHVIGPGSLVRRTVVKPSMCGPYALFVGQDGDWTWDAVSQLCNTNVFAARDANGAPTYLAFYYDHIRGNPGFHPGCFTFGDAIRVVSNVYNFGSESVLTLHKITTDDASAATPIDCREFYDAPRTDSIYVQNFNRWIKRRRESSNEDLVKSSPLHFEYEHLPVLPQRYSPRPIYTHARRYDTFLEPVSLERRRLVAEESAEYGVDITRDVNGVGLIYFAAYFSIIDAAFLRLWRKLARSDESFLRRVVLDSKICYLGNANIDSVLVIDAKLWGRVDGAAEETLNVVIRDRASQRRLAIATLTLGSDDTEVHTKARVNP